MTNNEGHTLSFSAYNKKVLDYYKKDDIEELGKYALHIIPLDLKVGRCFDEKSNEEAIAMFDMDYKKLSEDDKHIWATALLLGSYKMEKGFYKIMIDGEWTD